MTPQEEDELLKALPGNYEQDKETDALKARVRQLGMVPGQESAPAQQPGPRPQQSDILNYIDRPADPAPREPDRSFDWGRALTAFGGGDVGAYDARKRYQDEAPIRQMQYREMQEEQADKQRQRQLAQQMLDPNSPTSKAEQASFADYMNGLANAVVLDVGSQTATGHGDGGAERPSS